MIMTWCNRSSHCTALWVNLDDGNCAESEWQSIIITLNLNNKQLWLFWIWMISSFSNTKVETVLHRIVLLSWGRESQWGGQGIFTITIVKINTIMTIFIITITIINNIIITLFIDLHDPYDNCRSSWSTLSWSSPSWSSPSSTTSSSLYLLTSLILTIIVNHYYHLTHTSLTVITIIILTC